MIGEPYAHQIDGIYQRCARSLLGGSAGDMPPALAFANDFRPSWHPMNNPVTVDIPHQLGREAAKDRLRKGLDKLTSFIPGAGILDDRWDGDSLSFKVRALGQTASAKLDVFDDRVHAVIDFPPLLSLFADKARQVLLDSGRKLLR